MTTKTTMTTVDIMESLYDDRAGMSWTMTMPSSGTLDIYSNDNVIGRIDFDQLRWREEGKKKELDDKNDGRWRTRRTWGGRGQDRIGVGCPSPCQEKRREDHSWLSSPWRKLRHADEYDGGGPCRY
jgi:hypothetical protein